MPYYPPDGAGTLDGTSAATPIFGHVTGGSSNTLVMSTPSSPVLSYINGGKYIFISDEDIPGGSTTLNISGVGAVQLETHLTVPPSDGDLKADTVYELVYISADDAFYLSAFVYSELTIEGLEGLIEGTDGHLESPANKTYVITQSARYTYDINSLIAKTVSGTLSAAIHINGTPITGINTLSVSSIENTGSATALNSVALGDTVTMVITSGSSPVDYAFTIKTTRTKV